MHNNKRNNNFMTFQKSRLKLINNLFENILSPVTGNLNFRVKNSAHFASTIASEKIQGHEFMVSFSFNKSTSVELVGKFINVQTTTTTTTINLKRKLVEGNRTGKEKKKKKINQFVSFK